MPRVDSAFQKGQERKDYCPERRWRHQSAAEHQLIRRVCKAAVVRLAETLAEELRSFHVDVNCIAPGALKTRFVEQVLEAGPEKVGAEFFAKNKKWSDEGAVPLELGANLAVYLASAESNGITGKLISAQWDPWEKMHTFKGDLGSDIYTLRRIVPKDRGKKWGDK